MSMPPAKKSKQPTPATKKDKFGNADEEAEPRRINTLAFLKDKFMSTKITEDIPVEAGVTL